MTPLVRAALKVQLLNEQKAIVVGRGYIPLCPHCRLRPATDMHEAIITRGWVQKMSKEEQELIYVRENCVVLCHECHMADLPGGLTQWFIDWRYKGDLEPLRAWLKTLPFKIPPEINNLGG